MLLLQEQLEKNWWLNQPLAEYAGVPRGRGRRHRSHVAQARREFIGLLKPRRQWGIGNYAITGLVDGILKGCGLMEQRAPLRS